MMLESQRQTEQFNQSYHYELISNPSPSSLDQMKESSAHDDYGCPTSVNQQYKYWNPATSIDASTINNDHLVTLDSISHEQMKKSVDQLIGELCPLKSVIKKMKSAPKSHPIRHGTSHHRHTFTLLLGSNLIEYQKTVSSYFHDKLTLIFLLFFGSSSS